MRDACAGTPARAWSAIAAAVCVAAAVALAVSAHSASTPARAAAVLAVCAAVVFGMAYAGGSEDDGWETFMFAAGARWTPTGWLLRVVFAAVAALLVVPGVVAAGSLLADRFG